MPRLLGSLVASAALIAVTTVGAQTPDRTRGNWNQDYDPMVFAFGLGAGFSSGTGLAVRWPALPQTMATVTGGAWGSSDELKWNLGGELHVVLRQAGRVRFFVGPSVAVYSDHEDGEENWNASLGIGTEFLLRPRTALKLDLGFTYLGDGEEVYPLPQIGLYYYF